MRAVQEDNSDPFVSIEANIMLALNATRPVLLGRLAVYALDIETARRVCAMVDLETQARGFGTVTLDDGQEIDWVDMGHGVVPSWDDMYELFPQAEEQSRRPAGDENSFASCIRQR